MPKYKGKYLTWNDRLTVEKMLQEGYDKPQIARYPGVHHSIIYDECRRRKTELLSNDLTTRKVYSPEVAVAYHKKRVKNTEEPLKIGKDRKLARWLVDIISAGYSPAAACIFLGKTQEATFSCTLCHQIVYKYIENGGLWPLTNKGLRYKGEQKRKYRKVRAAKTPRGDSIERGPEHIDTRQEPGHWEMGSVPNGKGARAALLVLTERVMRYGIAMRMPNHAVASVVSALDRLEWRIGTRKFRDVFKSITVDSGTEFSGCQGMERSWRCHWEYRTHIYHCHLYSSFRHGSNKKQNQAIRWHFPKRTNFGRISQTSINKAVDWLNNYPRKILNWHTSAELLNVFLASL